MWGEGRGGEEDSVDLWSFLWVTVSFLMLCSVAQNDKLEKCPSLTTGYWLCRHAGGKNCGAWLPPLDWKGFCGLSEGWTETTAGMRLLWKPQKSGMQLSFRTVAGSRQHAVGCDLKTWGRVVQPPRGIHGTKGNSGFWRFRVLASGIWDLLRTCYSVCLSCTFAPSHHSILEVDTFLDVQDERSLPSVSDETLYFGILHWCWTRLAFCRLLGWNDCPSAHRLYVGHGEWRSLDVFFPPSKLKLKFLFCLSRVAQADSELLVFLASQVEI